MGVVNVRWSRNVFPSDPTPRPRKRFLSEQKKVRNGAGLGHVSRTISGEAGPLGTRSRGIRSKHRQVAARPALPRCRFLTAKPSLQFARSSAAVKKGPTMRVRSHLVVALVCCFPMAALAQNQPASTVRTVLATGRIASVVDTPLVFRLLSFRLPAAQAASYTGPNAMLYAISGALGAELGGNSQGIAEGGGLFIPVGQAANLSVSEPDPAHFLLFILSPAADAEKPLLGPVAAIDELYRSPEPLPSLQAGPHEFSLTRVSLPPAMPPNPPHSRSGAALYFIAAGNGTFIAEGKTEPRRTGMAHFEPHGLVHQWANPGNEPLVLIQANISQEGIPAVVAGSPK